MKLKNYLILSIAIAGVFMLSSTVWSTPSVSILYQETNLGGVLWQYDYTFENTSSSKYLYNLWLDFDTSYNITNPVLPGAWGGNWGTTSPNDYLETHSNDPANDIAPGTSLSGFSFTVNAQLGNLPFTAYFDDYEGKITSDAGFTAVAAASPPVVPEPVSSVLFITGGAALALRKRFRRKK